MIATEGRPVRLAHPLLLDRLMGVELSAVVLLDPTVLAVLLSGMGVDRDDPVHVELVEMLSRDEHLPTPTTMDARRFLDRRMSIDLGYIGTHITVTVDP